MSASTTRATHTPTRTSIRCSSRIFFTLASRSGTSRIVYDLSKEPPGGWNVLTQTRRARDCFPARCEPRASLPLTRTAVQYCKIATLVNYSGGKKRALGSLPGDIRWGPPDPPSCPRHSIRSFHHDDGDVVVAA